MRMILLSLKAHSSLVSRWANVFPFPACRVKCLVIIELLKVPLRTDSTNLASQDGTFSTPVNLSTVNLIVGSNGSS